MEKYVEELLTMIMKLRESTSQETVKKLDLDKCERIVKKLASFSESCRECEKHLLELKTHFLQLEANIDQIATEVLHLKQHKIVINDLVSHLQKEHKLVQEGTYLSLYMTMGISLSLVFGLLVFDNFALALPFGLGIGLAIGAGLDADAKKKGNTI